MSAITAAIHEIDAKIQRLQDARATLLNLDGTGPALAAPRASRSPASKADGRSTRTMTDEQRARIREAQQKRWAGVRAAKEGAAGQPPALPQQQTLAAEAGAGEGAQGPEMMEPSEPLTLVEDESGKIVPSTPATRKAAAKKKK